MQTNNHEYGLKGELLAKDFIVNQGFSVIAQNFRYGKYGEIDILHKRKSSGIF